VAAADPQTGDPARDEGVFRHEPPRLAVTGGIGSGKSTALAFLAELGAAVLSSDQVVHEAYEAPQVLEALRGRFGDDIFLGRQVNRAALSNAVFEDRDALLWLERLLHPLVRQRIEAWAAEHETSALPPALLAVEVPLLFESGQLRDLFDCVLLVTAPADVRRRRLAAKMTAAEFDRRAARQMGEDEKADRSEFVFGNTGSRTSMKDYLAETYASILACAAAGSAGGGGGVIGDLGWTTSGEVRP